MPDKSIDGDGLDTGLLIMGLKQGMEFMSTQKNMEAIFITKDKGVYITPRLKENFKLVDNSFTLKN